MKILASIFAVLIIATTLSPIGAQAYTASFTTGEYEPIVPKLQVQIPGLSEQDFEGSVIIGSPTTKSECARGKVCVNTISTYLNAVFKFSVTAGVIFSIIIIMIGGIEYMVGSSVGGIEKAKKHIKGATMGLALLLAVTSVVTFVNPNASGLKSLELDIIKHIPGPPKHDVKETAFGTAVKTDLLGADGEIFKGGLPIKDVNGDLVKDLVLGPGSDNIWMHEKAIIRLQAAAGQLNSDVSSGVDATRLEILQTYIHPSKAAIEFYNKCVKNSCAQEPYCNPFPENLVVEGSYTEGFQLTSAFKSESKDMEEAELYQLLGRQAIKNDEPRCPYQTGYAVAAVCYGDSIFDTNTLCQAKLERIMQTNNFCRSLTQPWLYEFKGKQVLDSTKNCEADPGTMLIVDPNALAFGPCNSTSTFPYQSNHSGLCAREYAEECSDINPLSKDNVDLTTGECL